MDDRMESLRETRFRRRSLLVGAAATTAAAILSACGSNSSSATNTPAVKSTAVQSTPQASGAIAPTAALSPASTAGAASAVSAAPTANASAGTPKKGGILRYGLSTDPSNFEPHVSTGAASGAVKLMAYSTLITYDTQGQLVGDLAESFGWPDNKTFEVKLRQGVQFHNGDTLTPDDVVFTFQRIMDPKTAASNAPYFADVATVETGDNNVVRFRLKQPNATLPYGIADGSSLIVSKKWITSGVDPKTTMMGTGPFKFVERKPGVSITMTRNPNYFLPNLPYLDGITVQPMADDNARVTALRSGSVDFIDYVPYTQMDIIQKSSDLVFKSDKVLGFGWLAFVVDRKPVDDVRIRQAFAYGMDRQKMVDVAFSGHGAPITGGIIPEGWVGYSKDLEGTYNVNYDKSKSLLQAAGMPTFNTDVLTTSSYSVIQRPAIAAQAELKNANINVNLVQQEWLPFNDTVKAGTYAIHVWGSAPAFNDPDFLTRYVGSGGFFAQEIHFKDDQIDQWLTQGRQTLDPALRGEIYHNVEKRVLDLVPWTYLIRREQGEAMQKYVKGYTHLAAGSWTQITLRETWLDK
jgi:peptide/nickel transport system substrate-binding protein